ncbi:MAG: hypothetical protein LBG14_07200 [Treponema sp.]|jgi:hypothetical protein|nr:hypothetical protein [Treponema sp.]
MEKNQVRFALLAVLITVLLSCGIPTLPKAVVVKAAPRVSVPLGRVNYNLYSGLSGGSMNGKRGSLDDILGASWLQDFRDSGITLYDYRPSGAEDDNIQRFLIHYRLDMEDIMGGSGELDLSKYRTMLEDLTETASQINDVSFDIPSMEVTESFPVDIKLGQVAGQIEKNLDNPSKSRRYSAYLPAFQGNRFYKFPEGILEYGGNDSRNFSTTLENIETLTLEEGRLNFSLAITYGPGNSQPPQGSSLRLRGFTLTDEYGETIDNVNGGPDVLLNSASSTGEASIDFSGATLPQKIILACDLIITGIENTFNSYFTLTVEPQFGDFTISGVSGLVLNKTQIESLAYNFEKTQAIGGNLGDSFSATVGAGHLTIGIEGLFPPIDPAKPDAEGWNLTLDLSGLSITQDDIPGGAPGLSIGGPGQPLKSGYNDLRGENLNNRPVVIKGKVTASVDDNKLTFQNFPGGIKKGDPNPVYGKDKNVTVTMEVSRLSEVKVLAKDIGLDGVEQTIEPELGENFTAFKDWLNYIEFQRSAEDPPDYGLGLKLEIGTLDIPGGLGLIINAPAFGLDNVFQSLTNVEDPAPGNEKNAVLIFMNKDTGGYKLKGENLPGKGDKPLSISVELGLEDKEAQKIYKEKKILTLHDIAPGRPIEVSDSWARLLFDWTKMSIKPKQTNKGNNDFLPDYPFEGTFPDEEKGEKGIDLGDMPKGLGFYTPEAADEGFSARLYINLTRQSLIDGQWADDPAGDGEESGGWGGNLQVDLPNLDFRIRYGDGSNSDNLFTLSEHKEGTGAWTLSRPLAEILGDPKLIMEDAENPANPFMIYTSPALPDKAIPLGNFADALNQALLGKKEGPLFFDYKVKLADIPGETGAEEPGEILLYPEMLKKRLLVSVDLLLLFPLILQADPGALSPVVLAIAPDAGEGDLFQRKGPEDGGYLDMITSFGFDIALRNVAGLNVGKFFLENKTEDENLKYRMPIVDLADLGGNLSLDSGEMEKIKGIWPFVPQIAIEFEPGARVQIERNFNIGLQSVTLKAGGEYTFETGL